MSARGADQSASAGTRDQIPERKTDHDRDRGYDQAIGWIGDITQHNMAGKRIGQGRIERIATPDHHYCVVENQDQPEGCQHLLQMVAQIKRANDDALDRDGDDRKQGKRADPGRDPAIGREPTIHA